MGGSTRPRLRSEISCGYALDDPTEGTSARTRPLSCDEIMKRRKIKEQQAKEDAQNTKSTSREEIENLDHSSRDAKIGVKHSRDHGNETSPRKKKEKSQRVEDPHMQSKNKKSPDVEARAKHKFEKDVRYSADGLKTNRRGHVSDKRDDEVHDVPIGVKDNFDKNVRNVVDVSKPVSGGHPRGKTEEGSHRLDASTKRKDEKGVKSGTAVSKADGRGHVRGKQDKEDLDLVNKSKQKDEKDVRKSTEELKIDRRGHGRSKVDEHFKDDGTCAYNDKHRRDYVLHDRHMERNGGALERENKRKDRSADDDNNRSRDLTKKYDGRSRLDSENFGRKEKAEFPHLHRDESKPKRRRSRSQEVAVDKGRRSRSSSPKLRKNMSSREHDHGQLSSHHKDKYRHQSDTDWGKMSSNGSASHHRRHGGSSSGLGGYSPRKRKTEAAVKTPSPIRTPERKSAGWDFQPSGADKNPGTSVASAQPLVSQNKPSKMPDLAAGISVVSSMGHPFSSIMSTGLSAFKEASLDSVQLTQATRPMRRLYIDNVPSSASEKDIMDCLNTYLLSSGPNRVRGTRSCISCMIHKEKGQALVEFLTPEDASAALSLDGRSLSGNILKIRRPKDFVEVASGSSEGAKAGAHVNTAPRDVAISDAAKDNVISDVVKDSPHKIFVGGIAKGLSSKMIMEIVSAFGPLKAFHYEIDETLHEPCAFLEYTDESVTLKACAGLNGMKLGGRVLTVGLAIPDMASLENSVCGPLYGIPEHMKPLLETPKEVLKLTNVINWEAMELLSESDLDEIVEDVRLECSRFGSVVSIKVVKPSDLHANISEVEEFIDDIQPLGPERENHDHHLKVDSKEIAMDHDEREGSDCEPPTNSTESVVDGVNGDKEDLACAAGNVELETAGVNTADVIEIQKRLHHTNDDSLIDDHQMTVVCGDSIVVNPGKSDFSNANCPEHIQEDRVSPMMELDGDIGTHKLGTYETFREDMKDLNVANWKPTEESNEISIKTEGATENGAKEEDPLVAGCMFEVGCILVEFRRTEASCMAAHCLHGRAYGDRVVVVGYVPLEAYRARFPK